MIYFIAWVILTFVIVEVLYFYFVNKNKESLLATKKYDKQRYKDSLEDLKWKAIGITFVASIVSGFLLFSMNQMGFKTFWIDTGKMLLAVGILLLIIAIFCGAIWLIIRLIIKVNVYLADKLLKNKQGETKK